MFSRHVGAVVTALSWTRSVVVEQGRWEARRTPWKPSRGDTVRNLRTVHDVEPGVVFDADWGRSESFPTGGIFPGSKPRGVMGKHTCFEYEEFGWHKYRSFSARGDSPADVRWPEYTLQTDQRISERREAYHARFMVDADDGADEYRAELDEAMWRTLEIGLRCRLKVGALNDEVEQVTPVHD